MTEQSPKVVVTGASGYLGQHLLRLLTHKGYRVVSLVREPAKFLKQWSGTTDRIANSGHRPVGETSACADVALRPLVDGLSPSPRRALLEEGRALGRYLNGKFPGYLILSRYVRALEQAGPPAQGHCLDLSPVFLKWPSALRFIDPKYPVCQLAPDLQKEMTQRIQFMAALSESNPRTASKYHARKPVLLPFVILDLSVRISVDILLRGLGTVVRLGCRLSNMTTSKDSKLADINS